MVNGRVWPVRNDTTLWLGAGPNVIEPAGAEPAARILDFNGNLRSASVSSTALDFSYQSNARAVAVLNTRPSKIEIDGVVADQKIQQAGATFVIMLPRGQHVVTLPRLP